MCRILTIEIVRKRELVQRQKRLSIFNVIMDIYPLQPLHVEKRPLYMAEYLLLEALSMNENNKYSGHLKIIKLQLVLGMRFLGYWDYFCTREKCWWCGNKVGQDLNKSDNSDID